MGTDLNAALSGSSSATSGIDQSGAFSNVFSGDVIAGGKKPTPPWLQLGAIAAFAVVVVVWLVRR